MVNVFVIEPPDPAVYRDCWGRESKVPVGGRAVPRPPAGRVLVEVGRGPNGLRAFRAVDRLLAGPTEHMNVRLPGPLVEAMDAAAAAVGLSRREWLEAALVEAVRAGPVSGAEPW
ncbi:hypothetical protein [Nocardioides sp. KR10-350]|uniref:hypothetical protein n=1 Tax=Nocardioides cheoyonin TaxID=3156615 RepID=UPI0032B51160